MRPICVLFVCVAATILGAGPLAHGAVTVESNVVYAVGAINAHTSPGTKNLHLDVYRPALSSTASASTAANRGTNPAGTTAARGIPRSALRTALCVVQCSAECGAHISP